MRRTRRGVMMNLRPEALESKLLMSGDLAQIPGPALQFNPAEFATDRILVRYRPEAIAAAAPARAGTTLVREIALVPGLHVVALAPGVSVADALASYRADAGVLYAVPDGILRLDSTPNDTRYGQQWALNNVGQSGGKPDADIDAPEAWNISTGSPDTVIAVIDTGVDFNHPDLAANIWTNAAEAAGTPGVDDDGNGYVDDVHGYDFVNEDGDPLDDFGHGTHVSGTIAAVGNNAVGVVGINWNAKVMGLKFLGANGSGYESDAIRALDYAVMMGAKISNNSYGGDSFNPAFLDAIEAAGASGHIFVAAAGNAANDNDSNPFYPASYDASNLVSVAATDRNDQLASFSNFGATTVDIAAPGVSIQSTLPNGAYGGDSGTSMASPHVAGVAALVRSRRPNWTTDQVIRVILDGADPIPAVDGKVASGGRLNAHNALLGIFHQAPLPGTLAAYDFEALGGGPSSDRWTAYGLWHVTDALGSAPGHSAQHSLYYGKDESTSGGGNYNTGAGNAAGAISPTIDLTGWTTAELNFNSLLDVADPRKKYDRAFVQVLQNGVSTTVASRDDGLLTTGTAFAPVVVDLTPFVGGPIQIRLRLLTVDGIANDSQGWFVDDFIVRASTTSGAGRSGLGAGGTAPASLQLAAVDRYLGGRDDLILGYIDPSDLFVGPIAPPLGTRPDGRPHRI